MNRKVVEIIIDHNFGVAQFNRRPRNGQDEKVYPITKASMARLLAVLPASQFAQTRAHFNKGGKNG